MMYVDYIEDDDGHRWQALDPVRMRGGKMYSSELINNVIEVSRDLKIVGCTAIGALSLLSEFWKNIKLDESFHWQELRKLNKAFFLEMEATGLLRNNPEFLIDHWLFPVYSIDLSLKKLRNKNCVKFKNNGILNIKV